MNACSRPRHAGWWLRLALASGLAIGASALYSVPAEAAPSGAATVLAGSTSQQFPSYFRVTANGKSAQISAIALGLTCASGAVFVIPDSFAHVRIGPNGNLHAQLNEAPTAVSGGATVSGTDLMNARLNRKRTRVTGIWRLRLSYTFTDGTTDQCDSGPVRFTDTD